MSKKNTVQELAKEAITVIDACIKNGVIPIIQFTDHGQVINFVSLDDDFSEDYIPTIAEYQYEVQRPGKIVSKTDFSGRPLNHPSLQEGPIILN